MQAARLVAIITYPVKGMRGVPRRHAMVEPRGLDTDRRWMLVDIAGRFLSQRELPALARITAQTDPAGLLLTAPDGAALFVPTPREDAPRRPVTIWSDTIAAADAGAPAAAWLETTLGLPCRLVFQADAAARAVDPDHAAAGDVVSFADGFPVLLASEDSLADLNTRLATPIGMDRFRPNLVVQGAPAWAEDSWRRLRIGDALFRVAKPCERCVVTTIDQATGTQPDPGEPLRTLKTFRRDPRGRVLFGQNLSPDRCCPIVVGDLLVPE
jgi:uncharacterized protein YcbX